MAFLFITITRCSMLCVVWCLFNYSSDSCLRIYVDRILKYSKMRLHRMDIISLYFLIPKHLNFKAKFSGSCIHCQTNKMASLIDYPLKLKYLYRHKYKNYLLLHNPDCSRNTKISTKFIMVLDTLGRLRGTFIR